jgi:hypothetical protein
MSKETDKIYGTVTIDKNIFSFVLDTNTLSLDLITAANTSAAMSIKCGPYKHLLGNTNNFFQSVEFFNVFIFSTSSNGVSAATAEKAVLVSTDPNSRPDNYEAISFSGGCVSNVFKSERAIVKNKIDFFDEEKNEGEPFATLCYGKQKDLEVSCSQTDDKEIIKGLSFGISYQISRSLDNPLQALINVTPVFQIKLNSEKPLSSEELVECVDAVQRAFSFILDCTDATFDKIDFFAKYSSAKPVHGQILTQKGSPRVYKGIYDTHFDTFKESIFSTIFRCINYPNSKLVFLRPTTRKDCFEIEDIRNLLSFIDDSLSEKVTQNLPSSSFETAAKWCSETINSSIETSKLSSKEKDEARSIAQNLSRSSKSFGSRLSKFLFSITDPKRYLGLEGTDKIEEFAKTVNEVRNGLMHGRPFESSNLSFDQLMVLERIAKRLYIKTDQDNIRDDFLLYSTQFIYYSEKTN